MFMEIDPVLVAALRASMLLTDALRDLGTKGDLTVSLSRDDGLALLSLVAGANHREAESWSQQGRPERPGVSCLKIAGLTFEWPSEALSSAAAANDNLITSGRGVRACWAEDDSPALR